MAFAKTRSTKEFEIVSLIDVVFLLLVFGVVLSTLNQYQQISGSVGEVVGDEKTLRVTVLTERDDENRTFNRVVVESPGEPRITLDYPPDERLVGMNARQFATLQQSSDLSGLLERFVNRHRDEGDDAIYTGFIDVVLQRETSFQLVGFLLDESSRYAATLEWLNLRLEQEG
jgi:hypothetical protein